MNQLKFLKREHLLESDSELEELIDHIGNLLAEEYFHLMEETGGKEEDENKSIEGEYESSNICEIQFGKPKTAKH